MSSRKAAVAAPEQAAAAPELVQQLLSERRELKVANERLRLEIEEARSARNKPDRRLGILEEENRHLRQELAQVRAEHERLLDALARAIAEMEKASR
jgi:chromosome segregation ATPase